jgi:hypothetical protein
MHLGAGGYGPTTPFQSVVRPKQRAGNGRTGKSRQTEKPNFSRKGVKSTGSNLRGGKSRKVADGMNANDDGSGKDVVEIVDEAAEEDEERAVEDGLTVASSDGDEGVAEVDTTTSKRKTIHGGRQGTREGNADGGGRRQAKGRQQKSSKAEQSEDDEEEVVAIEAPVTRRKVAQTSGRAASQKAGTTKDKTRLIKDKEKETIDADELLDGPEGVAVLIDRVLVQNENANESDHIPKSDSRKDARVTRLREKIDRVGIFGI